jgi:hypothetical protein
MSDSRIIERELSENYDRQTGNIRGGLLMRLAYDIFNFGKGHEHKLYMAHYRGKVVALNDIGMLDPDIFNEMEDVRRLLVMEGKEFYQVPVSVATIAQLNRRGTIA